MVSAPTISSFAMSQHTHTGAAGGGLLTPAAAGVHAGVATVTFVAVGASTVVVSGQIGIVAGSAILLTIIATDATVLAVIWAAPVIKTITANTSFEIEVQTVAGVFTGNVPVAWVWV